MLKKQVKYSVLFVTQRGERHQQAALQAAPDNLDVTIIRTNSKQRVMDLLPGKDFLVSERAGIIDQSVIDVGHDLKLIQRLGSLFWDIDREAARTAGIPVCCVPVKTSIMAAEHMVMLILALARDMPKLMQIANEAGDWEIPPEKCDENHFAYNWSKRTKLDTLGGRTVGIIGFGETGAALARRLSAFSCTVLYNKRTQLPKQAEIAMGIRYTSRERLYSCSDFICCLLPYSPETQLSIGAKAFALAKRGAYFVHCGASGVVQEEALITALRSGHLSGAALDCFAYEPLRPDDPLLDLARNPDCNLILTPHVASGALSSIVEERRSDFANLTALIDGKKLSGRIV